MATDERKRQQKLAKRAAKQKEKKKQLRALNPVSMLGRLRPFADAPILHCYYCDTVFTDGIGDVVICRLRGQEVAFAHFLLDVFCLGVKDVHLGIAPRADYEEKLNAPIRSRFQVIESTPDCLRKLVEGGVAFARQFGIPPHADYQKGMVLFGDAAAAQCTTEFTYGLNGKPVFIPGPHDDAAKIARIMGAVNRNGGNYLLSGLPDTEFEDINTIDGAFEEDDLSHEGLVRDEAERTF